MVCGHLRCGRFNYLDCELLSSQATLNLMTGRAIIIRRAKCFIAYSAFYAFAVPLKNPVAARVFSSFLSGSAREIAADARECSYTMPPSQRSESFCSSKNNCYSFEFNGFFNSLLAGEKGFGGMHIKLTISIILPKFYFRTLV